MGAAHSATETNAPETGVPETGAPETGAPETGAPETGAPETSAPGTDAPETDAPETGASATGGGGGAVEAACASAGGGWAGLSSFLDKWAEAGAYVDAIEALPPTYEIGEVGGFAQVVPDPVSVDLLADKLDAVDKAEAAIGKWDK